MHTFLVRWHEDQYEYYCTDEHFYESESYSVLDFIDEFRNELNQISSRNTIILIERTDI